MIPRIIIAAQAFQRLKLYMDLCPFEVGGLGMVENREGDLLVAGDLSAVRMWWHSHAEGQSRKQAT
jgi:hypothetical protein